MRDQTPPKVFMSYSWTTPEHADWVEMLAKRLADSGVHVILDQWDLKPGQDKYVFMEQTVSDTTVTKVLMVCDRAYAEKANGRKGGVGDETQIITSKVYGEVDQRKFLPIIAERDENGQPYKPDYLQARLHIDLSDPAKFEEGFETLLRDIYEKPLRTRPPLGQPPAYVMEEGKEQLRTTYKLTAFKSALFTNKLTATGLAADYLDQLLEDLKSYNLQNRPAMGDDYKTNLLAAIADSLPHRDEFIDFVITVSKYSNDPRIFASIQRFFASCTKFITLLSQGNVHSFQPYRLIIPELFLYSLAAFIAYGHYSAVELILNSTYVIGDITDPYQRSKTYDYVIFYPLVEALEPQQSYSMSDVAGPTARLLSERATNPQITKSQLIDVDYVLYVRHMLKPSEYRWGDWRCALKAYLEYIEGPMPFFLRARTRSVFAASKGVIAVPDKQDLIDRFAEYSQAYAERKGRRYLIIDPEQNQNLMDIPRIDTQ